VAAVRRAADQVSGRGRAAGLARREAVIRGWRRQFQIEHLIAGGSDFRRASDFPPVGFGGFVFATGLVSGSYVGAHMVPGDGAWQAFKDRNFKDHVQMIDGREVLEKVVAMPIATWIWKSQSAGITHMGPMAQDFRAAFELGLTTRTSARSMPMAGRLQQSKVCTSLYRKRTRESRRSNSK